MAYCAPFDTRISLCTARGATGVGLIVFVADNPPTEIQALIDNHVNAFNTQNVELFLSVFGDDATIIDGIALIAG